MCCVDLFCFIFSCVFVKPQDHHHHHHHHLVYQICCPHAAALVFDLSRGIKPVIVIQLYYLQFVQVTVSVIVSMLTRDKKDRSLTK